jgi:hypothetical protein
MVELSDSLNKRISPEKVTWRETMTFLKMGMAQVDITPPIGIQSGGWGASKHSRSESVHRSLLLTALAKADENGKIRFIIGVDLILIGCIECAELILNQIATALGVSNDDVLFSSSHSHSTPWICIHRSNKEGSELIPDFASQVVNGAVKACNEAQNSLEDVNATWAYGKCSLASIRDLPCGSNMAVAFSPDVSADDTLVIGRLVNSKGNVIGVIANYACHATTLAWQNKSISPDFVGRARELVQDHIKAPMLFLQGASGDLAPRNQYSTDTNLADKNGEVLGYSIIATLQNMQSPSSELRWAGVVESGALLGVWEESKIDQLTIQNENRIELDVKVKYLKTLEELRSEWAGVDKSALEERLLRAERLRIGYRSGENARHPIWIWQWGQVIFIAHAGEAYSYLQIELRKRNPEKIIIVMNLTNYPGMYYLPTRKAYEHLTYPAQVTIIAEGSLESIVEKV